VDIKTKGYVCEAITRKSIREGNPRKCQSQRLFYSKCLWVIAACFMADYLAMTFTQGNIKDCLKIIKLV
jgi:hypothetical protein